MNCSDGSLEKKKSATVLKNTVTHLGFKRESSMWDSSKDYSSWSYFFFFEKSHILLQLQNSAVAEHRVSLAKQPVCQQSVRWAPARWSLVNGEGNTSLPHALASHALWKAMWCALWWCSWHSDTPTTACVIQEPESSLQVLINEALSPQHQYYYASYFILSLTFLLVLLCFMWSRGSRESTIWKIFNWAGIGEHQVLWFQNTKVIEKLLPLQKEKNPLTS